MDKLDKGNERPWEYLQGKDTVQRMRTIGKTSLSWRAGTEGVTPRNEESMAQFTNYVHKTGGQILQMRVAKGATDGEEDQKVFRDRKSKLNRIIRRKIKADEMDDNLVGIVMDKEWDTSMWTNQEIQAGCEALMMIFQMEERVSEEKKAQAILMLEKLTFRHEVASTYLEERLDPLIAKSASKKYRGGRR